MELEVALILIEEAVEPREELLGAVIGVEDDGDAVHGGNAADVVGSSNTTGNGRLLAIIADTLSGEVGSTAVRQLQDDGAVLITSSLERGDNGGGRSHVLEEVH